MQGGFSMKLSVVSAGIVLLLGWVALSGCNVTVGIRGSDLRATEKAKIQPDVEATVRSAVAATLTAEASYTLPLTSTVNLISTHGQYVTAMPDGSLRQTPELSDCGRFTLRRLDNDTVALETCQNRWVTAPLTGATAPDWKVTQSPGLGDCGEFVLHVLGHNRVAFETCAGRWLTAVGDNGEPAVVGYVIAQTYQMNAWEMFTMRPQP
jgi:hypothetical protein